MQTGLHRIAALVLVIIVVCWGILLSPPLKSLRPLIGLPEHLPASRFNGFAAEIIPPSREDAEWYLARIAHYYHALFATLIYAMLVIGSRLYRGEWRDALLLGFIGTLLTVIGGIGYAYVARTPPLHGIFIGGLAILYASGLLLATRIKPSDVLEYAQRIGLILLLIGGAIGGYIGASYMDDEAKKAFIEAKILSRYDPDLAEHNELWRAWVAHKHAMLAVAMAMAFLIALKLVTPPYSRIVKLASYMVLAGLIVTALATYAVWPFGGIAHIVITPASLTLLLGATILSFKTVRSNPFDTKGLLAWSLRIGSILLWVSVIVPGVIVAVSLRKPTLFINPEFRDPAWDWAELAYSIGHWHILLAGWGIILLLSAIATQTYRSQRISKIATIGGWLALIGYVLSSITVNLYMLGGKPEPYQPNPYNNIWLETLVEPSLMVMALGIAVSSAIILLEELKNILKVASRSP